MTQATMIAVDCGSCEAQRTVRRIASAFDNEGKAQEALLKLLGMKDNHIFRGLQTLVTPGAHCHALEL